MELVVSEVIATMVIYFSKCVQKVFNLLCLVGADGMMASSRCTVIYIEISNIWTFDKLDLSFKRYRQLKKIEPHWNQWNRKDFGHSFIADHFFFRLNTQKFSEISYHPDKYNLSTTF